MDIFGQLEAKSPKKLNPAGNLFDYAKLSDVSKNEIAKMDAQTVYSLLVEWAEEFDPDFAGKLKEDPAYAKSILAIGRGGKKPSPIWDSSMTTIWKRLYLTPSSIKKQ